MQQSELLNALSNRRSELLDAISKRRTVQEEKRKREADAVLDAIKTVQKCFDEAGLTSHIESKDWHGTETCISVIIPYTGKVHHRTPRNIEYIHIRWETDVTNTGNFRHLRVTACHAMAEKHERFSIRIEQFVEDFADYLFRNYYV